MSEKKKLNVEELKNVSGGVIDQNEIDWRFTKGAIVFVELDDVNNIPGKVIKRSYMSNKYNTIDVELYYIESTINSTVDGWYPARKFSGNFVNIDSRLAIDPPVYPW